MGIVDIEDAVDRIIARRGHLDGDVESEEPRNQKLQQTEYLCPECEKRKKLKKLVVSRSKSRNSNIICPGRHADVVDQLVSSKQKAM